MMAEQSQRLAIIVTAQDLASGKLSKVRTELASMGTSGKIASVGLGGAMAVVNKGEQALGNFKNRISGIASSLTMLGGIGGAFALGTALTSAVNQAKNYQQSMELIKTQTFGTQQEVDSMSTSLLDMARSVGTAPEDLAAGLYHIESAGLRGAKALDVLKVAAEGAKVGGADLESVTNALVAANQSGVKGVQDMGSAMGTLNGIVGAGNMRMQDLADAMGTGVLSTAKSYGVTLQSVGAALADMTDQGIPATDAATRLNSAMRLMAAPTTKAVKELASIGLSSTQLATDLRSPGGFLTAVTDLKTHLDKSGLSLTAQAALIAGAFGGKQSGAILTLIGNVDLLKQKTDAVASGAKNFGSAWAATQQDAQFKWDAFNASLSAAAIKVGTVALPVITDELDSIGAWVDTHGDDLAKGFANAMDAAKQLGGALASIGGAAMGIWNSIPGPMKDLLIKGVVADRTMKFFFGMSPIHAVVSLAEGAVQKGLGGLVSGIFTRGSSPANPMFVQGGIGGGGANPVNTAENTAVNAAEGAGGAGAAETTLFAGGLTSLAVIAVSVLGSAAVAAGIISLENKLFGITPADIKQANTHGQFGPRTAAQGAAVAAAALPTSSGGTGGNVGQDAYPGGPTSSGGTGGNVGHDVYPKSNVQARLDQIASLIGATNSILSKEWANAAGKVAAIAARSAAAHGGTALGASAQDATFQRDLIRETQKVEADNHTVASKVADLTHLESMAQAHGDTKTASTIAAAIRAMQASLKAAADGTTAAIIAKQFSVTASYILKNSGSLDPVVPAKVPVSIRDVNTAGATRLRYGLDRKLL
jgi:TP901 family phage tail tape measure protein